MASPGEQACAIFKRHCVAANIHPEDSVVKALRSNSKKIAALFLGGQFSDAHAIALATSLRVFPISSLHLDGNHLSAASVLHIASLARTMRTLTVLELSNNEIGDAGAFAIADAK